MDKNEAKKLLLECITILDYPESQSNDFIIVLENLKKIKTEFFN